MMSPSAPAAHVHLATGGLHAHGHLAERVDAAGHGVHGELGQVVVDLHDLIDGLVHRIDRPAPQSHTVRTSPSGPRRVTVAVGFKGKPQLTCTPSSV